ncbi:potassium voltage-gated channel protein Shaw-like [Haliotis cracherodii]|uniref:potassium voltage-gated channel protein Shaw-like n=1 Tax=Haliotis cracherodii TaxID=6455 RepID=UPI0039EABEEE
MAGPTILMNISGTKYEVSNATFGKLMDQNRSVCLTEATVKDSSPKEYFFERHSDSFAAILDFLHHGELHLPPTVCPNVFSRELAFWGIDISIMENCCYHNFVTFVEDRKTLRNFEKQSQTIDTSTGKPKIFWFPRLERLRASVWAILDNPSSSNAAKVFMAIVVLFVIASMFVIVASTHPLFQRNLRKREWEEYLGDEFQSQLPVLQKFNYIDDYDDVYYDEEYAYYDVTSTTDPNTTQSSPTPKHLTNLANKNTKIAQAHARVDFLKYIEYAALIFFTFEFLLRLLFCPSLKLYVTSVVNIFEFIALAALYISAGLELFIPSKRFTTTSADIIECVQFMRIFRFLRLVKNVTGFRVLIYSFRSSAKELLLLLSFLALAVLLFGSVMFYTEDNNQVGSIPDACWWALITMTTVGYGDVVPRSFGGKLIAAGCAISGVLLLAVTVPIFVNTFILFYSYSRVLDTRALEQRKVQRSTSCQVSCEISNKISPVRESVRMKNFISQ